MPNINFVEFDSMLRFAFNRKNKMLGSAFVKKSAIKTLTANYNAWCAKKGQRKSKEDSEWCDKNKKSGNDLEYLKFFMKWKITSILEETGFKESRARSLEQEDFMRLL